MLVIIIKRLLTVGVERSWDDNELVSWFFFITGRENQVQSSLTGPGAHSSSKCTFPFPLTKSENWQLAKQGERQEKSLEWIVPSSSCWNLLENPVSGLASHEQPVHRGQPCKSLQLAAPTQDCQKQLDAPRVQPHVWCQNLLQNSGSAAHDLK